MTDTGPEIHKRGPGRPSNAELQSRLTATGQRSEQPGAGRPDIRGQGERIDEREPTREEPRLQRRFKANVDELAIPAELVPEGQSWDWKNYSVAGKQDGMIAHYQAKLQANHWKPVMAEDCPALAAGRGITNGPIVYGSLMLMCRPKYLSDEARKEEVDIAVNRVRVNANRIKDAPPGTFERSARDAAGRERVDNSIRKTTEIGRADDNMRND